MDGSAGGGVPCRALQEAATFLASRKREDPAPESAGQALGDDSCSAGSSGNAGCGTSTAPSGSSRGLANFGSTGSSSSHSLQDTGNSVLVPPRVLQSEWCGQVHTLPSPSYDAVSFGTSFFASRLSGASREEAFGQGQAEHCMSSRTLSRMAANIETNLADEELLVASDGSTGACLLELTPSSSPDSSWHPRSFPSVPQAIVACSGDRNGTRRLLDRPLALPPRSVQLPPGGTPECSTPVHDRAAVEGRSSADAGTPWVATPPASFSTPARQAPASPSRFGAGTHGCTSSRGCSSSGSGEGSGTSGHTYGSFVAAGVAATPVGQAAPPTPTAIATAQRPAIPAPPARPGCQGTARRSRSDERQEARIFYDARFLPGVAEGGSAASKDRSKRTPLQPKPELGSPRSPGTRVTGVPGSTGPRHSRAPVLSTPRGGASGGTGAASSGAGAGSARGTPAAAGARAHSSKRHPGGADGSGSGGVGGSCGGSCGGSAAAPPPSPRAGSLDPKHQQHRSPPRVVQSQNTPRGSWAPGTRRSLGSPAAGNDRQILGGNGTPRETNVSKERAVGSAKDYDSQVPVSPRAVIGFAARNTSMVHGARGLESPGVGAYTPSEPGQAGNARGGVVPQARRFHYESSQCGTFLSRRGDDGWWR